MTRGLIEVKRIGPIIILLLFYLEFAEIVNYPRPTAVAPVSGCACPM